LASEENAPLTDSLKLISKKLAEWEMFNQFLKSNPDVAERYESHKTFRILKDAQ
jgi:hypothetical protein